MSIVRQLTDCLVLSGYHGPEAEKIVSEVDLYRAVQQDVRPLVGACLLGREVVYPSVNPSPPLSRFRSGQSHLEPFLTNLQSIGIPILN